MSKRRSDSKEEKWRRKLKKYEDKLLSKRRRFNRIIYSSDDDVEVIEDSTEPQGPHEEEQTTAPPEADTLVEETLLSAPVIEAPKTSDDCEVLINQELLQTLGDFEPEVVEWGEDILEEVAKRFQYILLNGLKKDTKEALHKRYLFKKNIPLTKAPLLNPELSSILSDTYKNQDKTISTKQDQLGKALTALGKAMSALMLKSPNLQDVMRQLSDCSQLIADSHYNETCTRRSLVIPLIDKSLTESLKDRKRDDLLFGKDHSEMVKNSRGIKKTGSFMQVPAASTSLNWKGPLTRSLPARNFNFQSNRASGQKPQQYTRGRRFPPPPAAQRRATHQLPQTGALAPPPGRRQPAQPPTSRRSITHTGRDRSTHL